MKNKINTFGILLLIYSLAGCVKLDQQPHSFISPQEFYKSESDANASVIGIYPYVFSDNRINFLNVMGCVGSVDDGRFLDLSSTGPIDNDELNYDVWVGEYTGIRMANTTIDGLKSSPISNQIKNRYLAEAKVLRAYFYFDLLRLYGDIPYRDSSAVITDKIGLTPMKEIYENTINDLRWAIPYMWQPGEKPTGRVDIIAAKTLLADIYITLASSTRSYNPATSASGLKPYYTDFKDSINAYYQNAKQLCGDIISNPGKYQLLANWTDLWGKTATADNRGNAEFIWVNQTIDGIWGFEDCELPAFTNYAPAFDGGPFYNITYEFVKTYNPNDTRFKEGFVWSYIDVSRTDKVQIERWRRHLDDKSYPTVMDNVIISETADTLIWEANYWGLAPKKFFDETYKTNLSSGMSLAHPLYRMADIYLWYSEAENELNGMTQDCVDKINPIRLRANLPLYTAGQYSKDVFRNKILDERLWEFYAEEKDYFDLVRFGQLEERCKGVETAIDGKDTNPDPRPRTAANYWVPYPALEKKTNTDMANLDRMNYN